MSDGTSGKHYSVDVSNSFQQSAFVGNYYLHLYEDAR